MKKILFLYALTYSTIAFSQVGFNTPTPEATLDITAKNSTGNSVNVDGLLIPRVDRQKAQSMSQVKVSTIIYVNNISTGTQSGTTANVDSMGFYYFDGTLWTKFNSTSSQRNIYNINGTLSGNRTVAQRLNTIAFTGNSINAFSVDQNTFSVDATNHRIGIGTRSPQNKVHLGTDAPASVSAPEGKKLALYNNAEKSSFYGLGISANKLQIHASSKNDEAPAMVITNNKNVGIGNTDPGSSTILDLSSANRGFLMPRLSTAQRDAISPKVAGLAIYNSTINCMQYWNGSSWKGRCPGTIINPPPPDLSANCTGAVINNFPVGTYNFGSLDGQNLIATYTTNTISYKTSSTFTDCNLTYTFNPSYSFTVPKEGWNNGTSKIGTVSIKFNRPVTNLKAISMRNITGTTIKYTFKRNGVVVYPTVTFANIGCSNSFNASKIGNDVVVRTITGSGNQRTGGIYNMGGVWFDEVTINKDEAQFFYNSLVTFCLGNAS
ncbi:hypothetical protein [Chryseobacterium sp. MMS23-Vi53]|uniref:hypothetical protein n=1 Tax=Chryseobacterium sp. MMS23-Vi53 TaxID=3386644 RepID=UPI0039E88B61